MVVGPETQHRKIQLLQKTDSIEQLLFSPQWTRKEQTQKKTKNVNGTLNFN